jgi:pseudoazurin
MKKTVLLALAATLSLGVAQASAAVYNVKEVNSGAQGAEAFDPGFIKMNPGDTLHIAAGDAGHNMESMEGMIPPGAQPVRVAMSHDADIKLTTPGVYVFRCVPHYGMGMVLVVQVGSPVNLAQIQAGAQKAPPLAKKRLLADLALVK